MTSFLDRYEKGLNFEYTDAALDRACYLLEKYASGKVLSGKAEYDNEDKKLKKIEFTTSKVNSLLGIELTDKDIETELKKLDFEYLITFSETGAVDIPPMQKDDSIINNANKIILRDNNGFYSTDESFQNKIVNEQAVFTTLHNYITNKEKIMSGKRTINSRILNRKEVLLVANYLHYGSIREEILTSQTREKEKVFTKTKEL